ncbi:MAG TPA: hypothetical protein VF857_02285, partial [Spirochaetota bacterium]
VIILSLFACSRNFELSRIKIGSQIGGKGHITNDSVTFVFHYTGKNSYRDLCNFIYFEGDTLCFSADFTGDLSGTVNAVFADPLSSSVYPAERVEIIRSRAYGFSLVGSLLEHFNRANLDAPIPAERVIHLPFVVRIEGQSGDKTAHGEKRGECIIKF